MSLKNLLWSALLGGTLLAAGCVPAYSNGYGYGSPYGIYDSYSGRGYDPYYAGSLSPYGYGLYDNRSPREVQRDLAREHEKKHENLERQYDKAMRRLDRQEREAEEKAYRKYGGNISDPGYRDRMQDIDRTYDHKRDKVERNLGEKHRDAHRNLQNSYDAYYRRW
jgi:hypothetical protein